MSWHGGTDVMYAVIMATKDRVPSEDHRLAIYSDVWDALSEQDWWGGEELRGVDPTFDKLLDANSDEDEDIFGEDEDEDDES